MFFALTRVPAIIAKGLSHSTGYCCLHNTNRTRKMHRAASVLLRQSGVRTYAGASRVKLLGSHDAYKTITKEGSGRKTIVYFTAKWCPPCKFISPIFDQLSYVHTALEFVKVDVDELKETAHEAGVSSMPTFHFFRDGTFMKDLSFTGADESLLRTNAEKLNELKENA
uniref:Uncharacterized protein AlNc14C10G1255 n=1 Tax=Albugo laibachii Nc14 TaxID=890382 RepID=F0W2K8_9STRA|nr:conserved hypothetical protein [Albugo laibachii Nc14]|eukprot:CCA15294.1 conserved hypothetical protein [Albugo laibachii Nc14]